ncbi:MAG: hypothetical protein B7Z23_10605 [Pseudomonadales bacterium 32-61-5]|nr:MAG: hypothetical protein B7Z23_10605 [Pseudomonadales bacterium 32-61-5]
MATDRHHPPTRQPPGNWPAGIAAESLPALADLDHGRSEPGRAPPRPVSPPQWPQGSASPHRARSSARLRVPACQPAPGSAAPGRPDRPRPSPPHGHRPSAHPDHRTTVRSIASSRLVMDASWCR